jgi:hypothetical protein
MEPCGLIVAAGGEYRHRTIIPAMLAAPRRAALVTAKTIAIAIAVAVLGAYAVVLLAAAAQLVLRRDVA